MKRIIKIKIKYIGEEGERVEQDKKYEKEFEEFLKSKGYREDAVDVKNVWDINGKLAKKFKRKSKIVRTVVQRNYVKEEQDAVQKKKKAQEKV